jgi:hypothetical protein
MLGSKLLPALWAAVAILAVAAQNSTSQWPLHNDGLTDLVEW